MPEISAEGRFELPGGAPFEGDGKGTPYAMRTFGAKGIGELGATGVAAAVANAVFAATGKRVRELPILPEALVRA